MPSATGSLKPGQQGPVRPTTGPGSPGNTPTPQGPVRPGETINKSGGSSGGGYTYPNRNRGGSGSSGGSSSNSGALIQGPTRPGESIISGVIVPNRYLINNNPIKNSSEQTRQNVLNQSEALARDTNYAWNIKPATTNNNWGSRTDVGGNIPEQPSIKTASYIEQRKTGELKTLATGYKAVPTYSYTFVDPFGKDLGGGAKGQTERLATLEEVNYLKQNTGAKDLVASEKKMPFLLPVKDQISSMGGNVQSTLQQSFAGLSTGKVADLIGKGVDTGIIGLPFASKNIKEAEKGFLIGTLQDIEQRPVQNIALAGVSIATGFGGGALLKGLSVIPKVGPSASVIGKYAGVGIGGLYLGSTAFNTATKVSNEPDYYKKGAIAGIATKDLGISLAGFGLGFKGFQMAEGAWATRGLTFLETKQGIYPSAPAKTHLSLFEKNVIPELGSKPGAFHVTGDSSFWKGGKLIPLKGKSTSEIDTLYGSTFVSTQFSRISGSNKGGNIVSWFKALNTPVGKPGIAFLQPEGFRYNRAVKVRGQDYPYAFTKPAKQGFADIPGIKNEIEAGFRPEAGGYSFTSRKYYTKINGVRVPIDSFTYDPKIVADNTLGLKLVKEGKAASYPGSPRSSYSTYFNFPYSVGDTSSSGSRVSYSVPTSSSPSSGSSLAKPYSPSGSSSSSGGSYATSFASSSVSSSVSPSSVIAPLSYSSTPSSSSLYSYSQKYDYPSYPSLGGFSFPKPKSYGRKYKAPIAPSFSAIIGGTKALAPIKVSKVLGVSPFTVRGMYSKKVGKKNYIKLVDF